MSNSGPKSYSYAVAAMAALALAPTFNWIQDDAEQQWHTAVHSHPLLSTAYLEVDLKLLGSSKRLPFNYLPNELEHTLKRTCYPSFNLHFSVIYWVLVQIALMEGFKSKRYWESTGYTCFDTYDKHVTTNW